MADRKPIEFSQFNPPREITDPHAPLGGRDTLYPAHVHKASETGEYLLDYRVVHNDVEREAAYRDGYFRTPDEAIAAHAAKKADAEGDDEPAAPKGKRGAKKADAEA